MPIAFRIAPDRPARAPRTLALALYDKTDRLPPDLAQLDPRAGGCIAAALARPETSLAHGSVLTLYPDTDPAPAGPSRPPSDPLQRVCLLGLGDRSARDPHATADALRAAASRLARSLAPIARHVGPLEVNLTAATDHPTQNTHDRLDALARALGEGLSLGSFEFNLFKGTASSTPPNTARTAKPVAPAPSSPSSKPTTIDLLLHPDLRPGVRHALTVGRSVNLARTLAATPPNVANPAYLAQHCRKMSRSLGIDCRIIDAAEAKRLNMGGLLAVGGAGSTPPCLIVMDYQPRRRPQHRGQAKPLLLVGKAVTFDTGGYSIKPADSMDRMKYDKCGAMAVIGAIHAVASLKLDRRVVAIVPAAENLISSHAYRPADIITHPNGVTSEILNTDAEGRLILADALSFGTRTYDPAAVVDLATLTGACVIALGSTHAGCFCNNPELRDALLDAGRQTADRLWPMPLLDDHRQAIKGTHGDILNTGGREAGASTAAAFLSYFIEPDGKSQLPSRPWAHLDIAGLSDVKKETPLHAPGPTGFGVRLLTRWIESSTLPR